MGFKYANVQPALWVYRERSRKEETLIKQQVCGLRTVAVRRSEVDFCNCNSRWNCSWATAAGESWGYLLQQLQKLYDRRFEKRSDKGWDWRLECGVHVVKAWIHPALQQAGLMLRRRFLGTPGAFSPSWAFLCTQLRNFQSHHKV